MAIKRARESSPLWVWITVVLLVLGAISYAAGVVVLEYFMTAAS